MGTRANRSKPAAQRGLIPLVVAALTALVIPATAIAHLERPSYWPNPAPDRSISPPAGGKVPKARSLASALKAAPPGDTHVVCKGQNGDISMNRLERSVRRAQKRGYRLRPSEPLRRITSKRGKQLLRINGALARRCEFHSIQKAVFAAGNNDRVVIMPGRYTENHSRRQPVNDPRCNPSLLQEDASGDPTPSYAYQAKCPNDGNLIHVTGRAVKGKPVEPPRENRQGIPKQELGRCIQCNLQIEGSGVKPQDVLIDGGKHYANPMKPEAKPGGDTGCDNPEYCYAKHVVMRVDRADGFVARNFLLRGAAEFGFYAEEVDGMLLDRLKMYWAADYGHLSFTTDHHLLKNCDAFGAGDAALYPGAAPETGSQADKSFYPDAPRINTVVKKCDMRGSDLGFSGSMGNSTRITHNDIYGNVSGIVLDTLSSAGHPGFPADSSHIDHNRIYSNNLDLFTPNPPVDPVTPAPMGVGIVYAGMNDARVHHNWIFDNWRNGAMLFAVPDAATTNGGAEGRINEGIPCPGAPENGISTSCDNRFFANRMGQVPPGFRFPNAINQYGANAHGRLPGPLPNGNDFWWDDFFTNTDNCWFGNTGYDGTPATVSGPGQSKPPDAAPRPLPSDCSTSVGVGDPAREAYLLECANGPDEDTGPTDCDWWQRPPRPGTKAALREQRVRARAAKQWASSVEAKALRARIRHLVR
jgi:hypothetical protein